jgi:glc operon protein GlcG
MKHRRLLLLFWLLCAAASAAALDTVDHPTLTLDGARKVAEAAMEYARANKAPGGAIAIVDAGGNLLYLARLDGTFPAAADISVGKARTAAMFRRPTRMFEDLVNKGRYAMLGVTEVAPFTPLQGGVPVERQGQVVGAIGVSGAASAQQDDEIAVAGAAALNAAPQPLGDVRHVPRSAVEAGLRQGAELVREPDFRVDAGFRDGPGEAEVHTTDTDIFYVLDGDATFVTGGEIVNPRETSSGEIRGESIRGGAEIRLQAGDVIVIPRGVPHWFRLVDGPFHYYVVKSRSRT